MSDIKNWQRKELLQRCRLVVDDAEFAPDEGYRQSDVEFQDACGCYSEWTTESCHLYITLRGTLEGDGYKQARELEAMIRKWAHGTLEWNGCQNCGNDLSVCVSLFPIKVKAKAEGKV